MMWMIVNGTYIPLLDLNNDGAINALDLQLQANQEIHREGIWPVQGMMVLVTHAGLAYCGPGQFDVNETGYAFTAFGWPSRITVPEGETTATIIYDTAPMIEVVFDDLAIAVFPSDTLWRNALRKSGRLEHSERRLVSFTDKNGAQQVHFEDVR
jgi:hypothetical protein